MLDAVNGLAPSCILVVVLVLLMLLMAGASWKDRMDNRTDSLKEDPSKKWHERENECLNL